MKRSYVHELPVAVAQWLKWKCVGGSGRDAV